MTPTEAAMAWVKEINPKSVRVAVGDPGIVLYLRDKSDETLLSIGKAMQKIKFYPVTFRYIGPIELA